MPLRRTKKPIVVTDDEKSEYADELAWLKKNFPTTRADCVDKVRPCPFLRCRHHLMLDINPDNGNIIDNFVDTDLAELSQTCALDVADPGSNKLEAIGRTMNLTRERVRQIEVMAMRTLKAVGGILAEDAGYDDDVQNHLDTRSHPGVGAEGQQRRSIVRASRRLARLQASRLSKSVDDGRGIPHPILSGTRWFPHEDGGGVHDRRPWASEQSGGALRKAVVEARRQVARRRRSAMEAHRKNREGVLRGSADGLAQGKLCDLFS